MPESCSRCGELIDPQVRTAADRVQEAGGGAVPTALADGALVVADALLDGAVVVRVARHPGLLGAGDERLADRVPLMDVGDVLRAPRAVEVVGAARTILSAPEVRQHVVVRPAAVAHLRPGVEVPGLAADVEVTVDRARPAQHLAAREEDRPVVDARPRVGRVAPVEARILEGLQEPDRCPDIGMRVRAPGLQHQHADARVLRQPVGQHAAGRAGADDDVVPGLGRSLGRTLVVQAGLPQAAMCGVSTVGPSPAIVVRTMWRASSLPRNGVAR